MAKVKKIISGGQSGVDRAALDFAINNFIEYGGWCPKGGLAEDYPSPPGLLDKYKKLKETPSNETSQRTIWNVRDSDATIIIVNENGINFSLGTKLTIDTARDLNKQIYLINADNILSVEGVHSWLNSLKDNGIINIAGPRASESSNIYLTAYNILKKIKSYRDIF